MESFRRLTGQISAQLKLLNPSQRLAIGLCAVIVAGSLVWLLSWSATPDRVPLLSQDLSLDDTDKAEEALRTADIDFEIQGRRILVSPADQSNAIRVLNRADALPKDTSIGFQALIEDDSPFRAEKDNEFRRQVALGNELAKVIASAPDVESARVFIQSENKRHLTGPGTVPTASVFLSMARGQQMSKANVEAVARLVSGAVPGLKTHEVKVIDALTLRSYSVDNPEDAWAADMLERKKLEEQHLLNKIHEQLSYIPGVLAAVTVDLDPSRRTTETNEWADPAPQSEKSRSSTVTSGRTSGETGTNPNVGVALTGAGTAGGTEDKETENQYFDTKPKQTTHAVMAPFAILRAMAAINIPRSFFVSVFKTQPGNEKTEPGEGDPVFEAIKKRESDRVQTIVQNIIMAQAPDDVKVECYYDLDPGVEVRKDASGGLVQAGLAPQGGGYADLIYRHGPQAGLVGLALFGLLTLTLMVRRNTRASVGVAPTHGQLQESAAVAGSDRVLRNSGGAVGEAESPDGPLQGKEVDEETLKFKQLGEQVSRIVEDSPQVAADLLTRWVNSD